MKSKTEYTVPPETQDFVRTLADRFPRLKPLLAEHINDNDEILPHVFFDDFTKYVLSLHLAKETDNAAKIELRNILDFLESSFPNTPDNANDDVDNLIAVSFLENLPSKGEEGFDIHKLLGPNLAAHHRVITTWIPRNRL